MAEIKSYDPLQFVPSNEFRGIDIDDPYGLDKMDLSKSSRIAQMIHKAKEYVFGEGEAK